MKKLIRNAAQCLACGDIIESQWGHHFNTCSCGNLSVDGGLGYSRRCFKTSEWLDLCEYREVPNPPKAEWAAYMTDGEWAQFCEYM